MKPKPLLVLLRHHNEEALKNQRVISVAAPRSGRVLNTESLIDSMKVDFRQHCCFNGAIRKDLNHTTHSAYFRGKQRALENCRPKEGIDDSPG
jgi:hypothetical protein